MVVVSDASDRRWRRGLDGCPSTWWPSMARGCARSLRRRPGTLRPHGPPGPCSNRSKPPGKTRCAPFWAEFVDRTPGSFLEEKDFSIAWHYRTCSQELAERRVIEAKNALDDLPSAQGLSLLEGSKVLEMRPQGVDKGAATKRWLRDPAFGFLLVAGDDLTDEDMFGAAPKEAWTVHVGNGPTRARFAPQGQRGGARAAPKARRGAIEAPPCHQGPTPRATRRPFSEPARPAPSRPPCAPASPRRTSSRLVGVPGGEHGQLPGAQNDAAAPRGRAVPAAVRLLVEGPYLYEALERGVLDQLLARHHAVDVAVAAMRLHPQIGRGSGVVLADEGEHLVAVVSVRPSGSADKSSRSRRHRLS